MLLGDADRRLKEHIGTIGSYKSQTFIGAMDTQVGSMVTVSSASVPNKSAPELIKYSEKMVGL